MKIHWLLSASVLLSSCNGHPPLPPASGPVAAAPGPVDPVETAILKARAFLLASRSTNGTWEQAEKPIANGVAGALDPKGRQWGLLTSAAMYALLDSGVRPDDPTMAAPLCFLARANIESTSALGLRAQILTLLPPGAKRRETVQHDARKLLCGINLPARGGAIGPAVAPETGFYSCWIGGPAGTKEPWFDPAAKQMGGPQPPLTYDRGNSQFAVLGVCSLEKMDVAVPSAIWKLTSSAWRHSQMADGAWNDRGNNAPDLADTAGGVASLIVADAHIDHSYWGICKGDLPDVPVEAALKWIDRHFRESLKNPEPYTLYCLSRAGRLAGRKYFSETDWYQAGAAGLLRTQCNDGGWRGANNPIVEASFALLFLSEGRRPVLVNKLRYAGVEPGEQSNERPRDAANLVDVIGGASGSRGRWQEVVVDGTARNKDLSDAPVLYISGSGSFSFTDAQIAALRIFIDRGGVILANADCGKTAFSDSIKAAGQRMFPAAQFRLLPQDHAIYLPNPAFSGKWKARPKVMAMGDATREFIFLVPDADVGRAWQMRSDKTKEDHFRLGANIIRYAQALRRVANPKTGR